MSAIAIVTSSLAFEARVRQVLGTEFEGAIDRWDLNVLHDAGADNMSRRLAAGGAELVLIGPGIERDEALKLAQALDSNHPEISVLLIIEPSSELWREAMRAGVREVVSPSIEEHGLAEAIDRALDVVTRRRTNLLGDPNEELAGRIITVVSPKGGSGKTVLATNLSVGLANRGRRTVLVDLDLQFGDVAGSLGLVPESTLVDLDRHAGRLDATTAKLYLTPHPSGLFVLAAPDEPAEGEGIVAARILEVLRVLRSEFEFVVVDTAAGLDEGALSAVEAASDLLALCTMDVPSVRGLRKELAALDTLGLTTQRRHFVLNRADSRVGITVDDVAATVGMPVGVAVGSHRSVPLSQNQGQPLLSSDQRSPVARQLLEVVDIFSPEEGESRSTFGLFRSKR